MLERENEATSLLDTAIDHPIFSHRKSPKTKGAVNSVCSIFSPIPVIPTHSQSILIDMKKFIKRLSDNERNQRRRSNPTKDA